MPKTSAPAVSVVVPTRNRHALLAATLEAIERQTCIPGGFEVIVADDGSTDETPDWLAANRSRFGPRVTTSSETGVGTSGRPDSSMQLL
jgi:glycosyltransferase involved in cell wall biosynthesis